jgi:hypothetical protein
VDISVCHHANTPAAQQPSSRQMQIVCILVIFT